MSGRTQRSGILGAGTTGAVCFVLLVFMIFGSLQSGFTGLNLADVFRILAGRGTEKENLILFDFRLVRIVLAVLVGAGLSVSGTIFQTISKNPLASPDLPGVSREQEWQ